MVSAELYARTSLAQLFYNAAQIKTNTVPPFWKRKAGNVGFSESLKLRIKKRADFTCCYCIDRLQKAEIHHIVPQAQGGPNTEENAAPLCSNCHAAYGGNPDFRAEIRNRRDHWFDQVADRKSFTWPEVPAAPLLDRFEITDSTEHHSKGGTTIIEGMTGVRLTGPDRSLAVLVTYLIATREEGRSVSKELKITAYTAVGLALSIRVGPLDNWLISGLMRTLRNELDMWILWGPNHTSDDSASDFERMHAFALTRLDNGENNLYMRAPTVAGGALSISAKFTNEAARGVAEFLQQVGIDSSM